MNYYSQIVGLTIVLTCNLYLSGLVSAQGFRGQGGGSTISRSQGFTRGFGIANGNAVQNNDRYGTQPRSGAQSQQRSSTSVSASRSVSFTKNGRRVSISENASGITVNVNGKRFRAKNPVELKRRYPDAYRLYDEHIGAAQSRGTARGFAKGSAGSAGSVAGLPMQPNASSTENRSVSVIDNGKKISITQNKTGITVSVNGKRVRAKNVAELKKKFPDAFKVYEKHLGGTDGGALQSDATSLLQEELGRLRDENADNPQLRNLIDGMIRNVAP